MASKASNSGETRITRIDADKTKTNDDEPLVSLSAASAFPLLLGRRRPLREGAFPIRAENCTQTRGYGNERRTSGK